MKGLLLKDFYMAWRYCRILLVLVVVFIALSWADQGSLFFLLYPIILVSMIPVTLLGYDERDRWTGYSDTLPYTRGQLVSAKYLVGLCFSGGAFLLSVAATLVWMGVNGVFSWEKLAGVGRDAAGTHLSMSRYFTALHLQIWGRKGAVCLLYHHRHMLWRGGLFSLGRI